MSRLLLILGLLGACAAEAHAPLDALSSADAVQRQVATAADLAANGNFDGARVSWRQACAAFEGDLRPALQGAGHAPTALRIEHALGLLRHELDIDGDQIDLRVGRVDDALQEARVVLPAPAVAQDQG